MYINKYDWSGQCAERGLRAEDIFKICAEKRGYETKDATRSENIHKHIDVWLNENIGIDVKARKKRTRKSKSIDDSVVWIEFKNVQGRRGWIDGDADGIAFEQEDHFVVLNRNTLHQHSLSLVNFDVVPTDKSPVEPYITYTRKGRKDVIAMIKTSDLYSIKHSIWLKPPVL